LLYEIALVCAGLFTEHSWLSATGLKTYIYRAQLAQCYWAEDIYLQSTACSVQLGWRHIFTEHSLLSVTGLKKTIFLIIIIVHSFH